MGVSFGIAGFGGALTGFIASRAFYPSWFFDDACNFVNCNFNDAIAKYSS